MRELGDGHDVVARSVGGELGVGYLEVDDAVDGELGVVAGDADLAGHVQRDFFLGVLVGDAVEKGNEEVEAGFEDGAEFAEAFDDVGFLLGGPMQNGFESEDDRRR